MSSVIEIFAERRPVAQQPRVTPLREKIGREAVSRATSVQAEQIQALVQQLFFACDSGSIRHVGFTAAEALAGTAQLCLEVARVLAQEGRYDIGLIDASPESVPLQTQLEIVPPVGSETTWPVAPRLRLVPRRSWLHAGEGQRVSEQSLSRLHEFTGEFDFSILCCSSVSWLTAKIGLTCDGLVLVLTANKTRRLVAAQMRDQLRNAHVPLLGTVLTARRFPVPESLYRSL